MSDFAGSDLERYIIEAQQDYDARMVDAQRRWEKKGREEGETKGKEEGEKKGREEGEKKGEINGERKTLLRSLEHFSQKRFGKSIDELSEVLQQKSSDELQNLLDVVCFAPSYEEFLARL